MNIQQKRAVPLYILLALIVLATTLLITKYGTDALAVNRFQPPSQEMIDHVLLEAENSIRLGRYKHAAGVLRRLLADVPQHAHGQLLMSICYYALEQPELAERSFRKQLKQRPHDARLLNNLGESLIGQGKYKDGINVLKQAARLAPDMPLIQLNLSAALSATGDIELASKYRNYANFLIQCGTVKSLPYMISNAVPRKKGNE